MILEYNLQLFAKEGPGGEKTEPATPKKLEKAREEGRVAKSQDINTAVLLIILFGSLRIFGGYMLDRIQTAFQTLYGSISDYATEEFNAARVMSLLQYGMVEIIWIILPIIALGVLGVFVSNVVQVKWKVTGKPLRPKFSKLNPIKGFKRFFSKDKLVELLKAVLKLSVLFYVVYSSLQNEWGMIVNIYQLDLWSALTLIVDLVLNISFKICIVFIIFPFVK